MSLIDHIKDRKVYLKYYREGSLYYETELGLIFEVPISDTGNGTFNAEEKAIGFVKWIREQLRINEEARLEQTSAMEPVG